MYVPLCGESLYKDGRICEKINAATVNPEYLINILLLEMFVNAYNLLNLKSYFIV